MIRLSFDLLCHLDFCTVTVCVLVCTYVVMVQLPTRCLVSRFHIVPKVVDVVPCVVIKIMNIVTKCKCVSVADHVVTVQRSDC